MRPLSCLVENGDGTADGARVSLAWALATSCRNPSLLREIDETLA